MNKIFRLSKPIFSLHKFGDIVKSSGERRYWKRNPNVYDPDDEDDNKKDFNDYDDMDEGGCGELVPRNPFEIIL